MSFIKGDIVRLATDDNSGDPMRVLEVNDFAGVTFCMVGDDDSRVPSKYFDTTDLELYPTIDTLADKIAKECRTIEDAVASIRHIVGEKP